MPFTVPPCQPGENAVLLWQQALASGEKHIVFSPGRYDFYPDDCSKRYCYFTNNDEGIKTIALDLQGLDGITIEGNDTLFFFHGRISPVVASQCCNLTICGITIDFEDSFVSDADLVKRENGTAWFAIGGKHSFSDGRLSFTGDFYDNLAGVLPFAPYDKNKKELVYDRKAVAVANRDLLYQDGLVGVPDIFQMIETQSFIIKHELRLCPGIVCDRCENVTLRDITLHHAAGMGVLMQCCQDIMLDNVAVKPSTRRASVSDDAVHMSDCRSKINCRNCHLEGTLDDSLNIHGVYHPLKFRIPGGKFYYLEAGHFQQAGIQAAFAGDTLELIKPDTCKPYGKIKLKAAKLINKVFTRIEFDEKELPQEYTRGDVARVMEAANAELEITNCTFKPLNGRGVLASGMSAVTVTGCRFHTSGAAIHVAGDAFFWYEAGPVEKMLIADNIFDNCCYKYNSSTRDAISILPDIQSREKDFFYHGDIKVVNNTFISAVRSLIAMDSVRKAEVCGNTFVQDNTYTVQEPDGCGYYFTKCDSPMINFKNCGECITDNNYNFI